MTEMTAPTKLFSVMGCLNIHQAGSMMMIGVNAMSVLAIPAAVYCTASSDAPTPTKGPNMVVAMAAITPLRSCMPRCKGLKPSRQAINNAKPIVPAIQRKKLAWNGSIHDCNSVVNDAS